MDVERSSRVLSEAAAAAAAPPSRGATTRRWWLLLLAALALHGGLRAWYAGEVPQLFDERYSVENVRLLLVDGNWVPRSAYYPRLSYLPQAAVLKAMSVLDRVGGEPRPIFADRQMTRRAFLLCRLLVVAYAVASLLLLFLLARRWFSPAVAFFAVVLLASMPIHFRLSIEFKPDMLVLALSLTTLLLSALALERGGWRWFLAAGAAAGLGMAAKLTGGAAAVPLAVGASWRARRQPRQLLPLALAGTTALVVFALTNPELGRYLRRLFGIARAYEDRVDRRPGGGLVSELLLWLLSPSGHGTVLGLLALAGLVGMAALMLAPSRRARLPFSYGPVVVGFPLAFVAIYRLVSDYFKPNNFLPLLPFTALGGSWLLVLAWTQLQERWLGHRRLPAVAAGMALAVFASVPLSAVVAAALFRSVADVAVARVESATAGSPAPPAAVVENAAGRLPPRLTAVRRVDELVALPAASLACSDAEVFPASRLSGPTAADYRQRLLAGRELRVRPSLLELVRGEEVVVVLHPRPLRDRRELPAAPSSVVALPGSLAEGTCVSVLFEIGRAGSELPRVLLDDAELPLRAVRAPGRRLRTTDRLLVTGAPQRLRVVVPEGSRPRRWRLQLLTW
jgi:hypothetical protein